MTRKPAWRILWCWLHPIKARRHLKAINAPWKDLPS